MSTVLTSSRSRPLSRMVVMNDGTGVSLSCRTRPTSATTVTIGCWSSTGEAMLIIDPSTAPGSLARFRSDITTICTSSAVNSWRVMPNTSTMPSSSKSPNAPRTRVSARSSPSVWRTSATMRSSRVASSSPITTSGSRSPTASAPSAPTTRSIWAGSKTAGSMRTSPTNVAPDARIERIMPATASASVSPTTTNSSARSTSCPPSSCVGPSTAHPSSCATSAASRSFSARSVSMMASADSSRARVLSSSGPRTTVDPAAMPTASATNTATRLKMC